MKLFFFLFNFSAFLCLKEKRRNYNCQFALVRVFHQIPGIHQVISEQYLCLFIYLTFALLGLFQHKFTALDAFFTVFVFQPNALGIGLSSRCVSDIDYNFKDAFLMHTYIQSYKFLDPYLALVIVEGVHCLRSLKDF